MQDNLPFVQVSGLEALVRKANLLIEAAKAPSTRRAYESDWQDFVSWCAALRLAALPSTPETVALYIADRASQLAPATLARRLSAITKAHQAAGFENSPASTRHFAVGEVLKGIRRTLGTAQKSKDPLLTTDIRRLLAACPDSLLGRRDQALILTGFGGAFRRSELASLEVRDLTFSNSGVVVHLRRSKTDQEQAGRDVPIVRGQHPATCPVRALLAWLKAAQIREGAVFRSIDRHGRLGTRALHRDSIGTVLKRAAARAGMNPENLAGHSVRSGMATQAAINGVQERDIAATTGHRSRRTLRRYIRPGLQFCENASARLGL